MRHRPVDQDPEFFHAVAVDNDISGLDGRQHALKTKKECQVQAIVIERGRNVPQSHPSVEDIRDGVASFV